MVELATLKIWGQLLPDVVDCIPDERVRRLRSIYQSRHHLAGIVSFVTANNPSRNGFCWRAMSSTMRASSAPIIRSGILISCYNDALHDRCVMDMTLGC